MGILDLFADDEKHLKKIETIKLQLANSFTNIRKDIELQNKWINFLNQNHSQLKHHHDTHKEVTLKQMENVASWIKHLNDNTKQHEMRVLDLEKHIQKAFKLYNDHLLEIHKKLAILSQQQSQIQNQSINVETIKKEAVNETLVSLEHSLNSIKRHFADELKQMDDSLKHQNDQMLAMKKELTDLLALPLKQTKEDPKQQFAQPLPQQITQQYVPQYSYDLLTNPEKKLLSLLFNETEPMTYEVISHKTGHSINTVRVNMNVLKKKGVIEEHMLPSGVKLFALSNKEKIKKMYNLEVI